jgi:hypothetical protein
VMIDGPEGDECGGNSSSREGIRKVCSWANFRTTRYGSSRPTSIIAHSTASCISRPLSDSLAISEFSVLCCRIAPVFDQNEPSDFETRYDVRQGVLQPNRLHNLIQIFELVPLDAEHFILPRYRQRHGSSRARGSAERVDQVGRLERVWPPLSRLGARSNP